VRRSPRPRKLGGAPANPSRLLRALTATKHQHLTAKPPTLRRPVVDIHEGDPEAPSRADSKTLLTIFVGRGSTSSACASDGGRVGRARLSRGRVPARWCASALRVAERAAPPCPGLSPCRSTRSPRLTPPSSQHLEPCSPCPHTALCSTLAQVGARAAASRCPATVRRSSGRRADALARGEPCALVEPMGLVGAWLLLAHCDATRGAVFSGSWGLDGSV
jgi:hypothetical protein